MPAEGGEVLRHLRHRQERARRDILIQSRPRRRDQLDGTQVFLYKNLDARKNTKTETNIRVLNRKKNREREALTLGKLWSLMKPCMTMILKRRKEEELGMLLEMEVLKKNALGKRK